MAKKLFFVFIFSFLISTAFSVPAQAARYQYDQEHSRVLFSLTHFGLVTVSGHFKTFSGTFRFDPAHIENSQVDLAIQAASLESGYEVRDQSLRSKNFFWTEKFPEITFVSRQFADIQGGQFNIYGDLTIRGKTVPVVFQTELLTTGPAADRPIRFHTQTFIRRKDFHLGTGNLFDPVMMVTSETLKISLDVQGVPAGFARKENNGS